MPQHASCVRARVFACVCESVRACVSRGTFEWNSLIKANSQSCPPWARLVSPRWAHSHSQLNWSLLWAQELQKVAARRVASRCLRRCYCCCCCFGRCLKVLLLLLSLPWLLRCCCSAGITEQDYCEFACLGSFYSKTSLRSTTAVWMLCVVWMLWALSRARRAQCAVTNKLGASVTPPSAS